MRFWHRSQDARLGDELRASRPEPSRNLVRSIVGRLPEGSRHTTRRPLRFALAGSLGVGVLVAMAAGGGFGYASSSVHSAVSAVKKITRVSAPRPSAVKSLAGPSAASDEYGGGGEPPPPPVQEPGIQHGQGVCVGGTWVVMEATDAFASGAPKAFFYKGIGGTCDVIQGYVFAGYYVDATGAPLPPGFELLPWVVAYPYYVPA
jgi:hypothetical protein